jgi:hypothetical protein
MTQSTQTGSVSGVVQGELDNVTNSRVTVVSPDRALLPDSGLAKQLTSAHPKYVGYNEFGFRSRLIKDSEFLDQYVTDVFDLASRNEANEWMKDPEQRKVARETFKANILNGLSKDMFTGEDIKGFVVNRELGAMRRVNDTSFDLKRYVDDIIRVESSNQTDAKNARSTATGLGQFINDTWLEEIQKHRPDAAKGKSRQEILDLRFDGEISRDVLVGFTRDNAEFLQRNGFTPNGDNVYLAHFLGRAGAKKFLSASNDTIITDVVNSAEYNANKEVFQRIDGKPKTVQEVKQYVRSRMGSGSKSAPVANPATRRPTTYNDVQIESIVKSNPAMFAELGISDEKGKLRNPPRVVAEKIGENPELERIFVEAQYDMFQTQLTKSNNLYFDIDDPDEASKAWVVYSRFGPEVLTQYVNYTQFWDKNFSFENQSQQAKTAYLNLRRVNRQGQGIAEAMDEWFSTPAVYSGIVRSADLENDIPLDLNGFTQFAYESSGLTNLVEQMREGRPEGTFSAWWAKSTNSQESSPEDIVSAVKADLETGIMSRESKGFYLDVLRQAQDPDSPFSLGDLFNTIMSNASPFEEDNAINYRFNYEDLPLQAKLAVNAIRTNDSPYQNMIRKNQDGSYIFEPNRQERIADKFASWGAWVTEDKPQWNPDGTYAGMAKVPDTGMVGQIANALGAFTFEAGQFFGDYGLAPGLRATKAVADKLGWENLSEGLEVGPMADWVKDFQDADLLQTTEGLLPRATVYSTEMLLYMTAMYYSGGLIAAQGARGAAMAARYFEGASAARQMNQLYTAGNVLGSYQSTSRLGLQFRNLQTALETGKPWALALRFESGGAAMEALGGMEKSIYNGGLVDDIVSKISNGTITPDTQKMYMTSDRLTQFGVDALTGFGLGMAFDNLFAVIKYGANLARRQGGRGLKWNPDERNFEKVESPVFSSDWRRFLYNFQDELQEVAIGSIDDSIRNTFNGRAFAYASENIASINDVATNFYRQVDEVYADLPQTIQDSIRFYDKRFGLGKMTDEQVAKRADVIYKNAMEDLAQNMVGLARGGTNGNADRFVWGFVDSLDNQMPTVKAVVNEVDGIANETYPLAVATRLRNVNPGNRVIKKSGDLYKVYEVDPGYWAAELSTRMRRALVETSKEKWAERSMLRRGLEPGGAKTMEDVKFMDQVNQLSEHMAGRPFLTRSGGKSQLGYIESFDGTSFYIRDSETGELRKMLDNEVLDFVSRKGQPRFDQARMDEQIRSQRALPEFRPPQMPENFTPIPDYLNTEDYSRFLLDDVKARMVDPVSSLNDTVLLDNIARLRRMGVSNREILDNAYGEQIARKQELEKKLAEIAEKPYAKESSRKAATAKIQKQLDELNDDLSTNENLLLGLIRQTDSMLDLSIKKKVSRSKKAAKTTKEVKEKDADVKETKTVDDCVPASGSKLKVEEAAQPPAKTESKQTAQPPAKTESKQTAKAPAKTESKAATELTKVEKEELKQLKRESYKTPKDLEKSAPRYGRATLEFESEYDKAAYIIANDAKKESKAAEKYRKSFDDQLHDINDVISDGNVVKNRIKKLAGGGAAPQQEKTIKVPKGPY